MAIDHDQICKNLIETFIREFMELFFAADAKLIDFRKVEFLREEIEFRPPDLGGICLSPVSVLGSADQGVRER